MTTGATAGRGAAVRLDSAAVGDLRSRLHGELIEPGDPSYEQARRVYNAMIDRHPALIARCADVGDVQVGVDFAARHGLPLAVRGGGHNGAGLGTCDDGLVLDLAGLKEIAIDAGRRTAVVGGGCTLGELDRATHEHGLAVPAGIVSTTGVGGLTLGGGIGHLTRRYGLTIDNLLGADVVLASGERVTASATEHEDLFWALRGGGGNFGVVTSFRFALHPVSNVTAGPTLYDLDRAPEVLRWYREFIVNAPEELNGFFAFMTVPPAPPFPEALHFRKMCAIVWCYCGEPSKADAVFAPVKAFGPPALYGVHEVPFPGLQTAFDGLYPPGHQWYWRADFVREIPDEAIARHAEFAARLPTLQSGMHIYPIDGAAHRVAADRTAFGHREARWTHVIIGVDPDPAQAELIRDWTVAYWEALHPYSSGGAYVNFMMDEGKDRVRASYGDNYDRLARVKRRYDPTNLFRINQNIAPA
jgi:FAD/FMN-containing dehydrogenase